MSVTVILEVKVAPGQTPKLLSALNKYLPETRRYAGFIDISVLSEEKTNKLILLSKWNAIDNYQDYLQWRTDTGVMDILSAMLTAPTSIRFFHTEIDSMRSTT